MAPGRSVWVAISPSGPAIPSAGHSRPLPLSIFHFHRGMGYKGLWRVGSERPIYTTVQVGE